MRILYFQVKINVPLPKKSLNLSTANQSSTQPWQKIHNTSPDVKNLLQGLCFKDFKCISWIIENKLKRTWDEASGFESLFGRGNSEMPFCI